MLKRKFCCHFNYFYIHNHFKFAASSSSTLLLTRMLQISFLGMCLGTTLVINLTKMRKYLLRQNKIHSQIDNTSFTNCLHMYLCKQNLGFIGFFMHNANLTISVAFKTSRQITSLKHSKFLRYTIRLFCASNGNYSSVKSDRL